MRGVYERTVYVHVHFKYYLAPSFAACEVLCASPQLSAVVQGMAKAGSLAGSPLAPVLVEMHALCLSRHPLQRAIAR